MKNLALSRSSLIEVALLSITLIWALNFSVIKGNLDEIDPLSFNGLRFLFAAAVIWGALLWKGQSISVPRRDWLPLIGMGLLANLVYQGLFIIGIDYTYAANVAVIMGTIPIWVALIAHLFSDEKLDLLKSIGVALAFGGVVFIMLGGSKELDFGSDTFIGDLLTIAATVVWGTYTVLSRNFLKRYTALQFSAITTTIGAITLFLVGLPSMTTIAWSNVSLGAYGAVIYSGLLSIGVAYIIWNYAIQEVGAVHTATYQNLVPVLGLIFGVILLGEELAFQQYLGSALVIGGIVLARWKKSKRRNIKPQITNDRKAPSKPQREPELLEE
ncbi:DMT family transporter [Aliifodinibius sp. S!AR15-10]|uniref:DMT family transporter n=1 Tax=Aliifodinibius sp. S!AR15-10 TaxID=2950437 RepID=UPI00287009C8|nr:DMT family transporter [Aliifodinibius sp. S!AR15-10]